MFTTSMYMQHTTLNSETSFYVMQHEGRKWWFRFPLNLTLIIDILGWYIFFRESLPLTVTTREKLQHR